MAHDPIAEATRLLVTVLGPVVAELLDSQLRRLATAIESGDLDDAFAVGVVEIVRGIRIAHAAVSGEEKHRAAVAAIRHAAQQQGTALSDSLINQLIELAVQRLKAS
jgi:hypothetical protein